MWSCVTLITVISCLTLTNIYLPVSTDFFHNIILREVDQLDILEIDYIKLP